MASLFFLLFLFADVSSNPTLWRARDAQDRVALTHIAAEATSASEAHATEPGFLYRAALAQSTLAEVAMEVHGGFGFAQEYDIERKWREARIYRTAPISTNMVLAYVAQHVLGLPRSY